jgi:short-subunit dehydrogenase
MDLRDHPGVHVSLIMPGVVTTDFARNVRGDVRPPITGGAPGGAPMNAQTPEDVAERIAQVIHNPVAELYTNPASAELARRYYADVEAFERGAPRPQSRVDAPAKSAAVQGRT